MSSPKKPAGQKNEAQRIIESYKLNSGDNWNELANVQEPRLREIILKSSKMMLEATRAVAETGVGDAEFETDVKGTASDLQEFANRLSLLAERRNGRVGPTTSDEDYTDYISLGLEYVALDEQIGNVLPLGLANVTEYHGRALRVKEEQQKLQDPDVVTDVTVKDAVQAA